MDIQVGPVGKLMFSSPQQQWHGDTPEIMQISRFAGQEMMAIQKSDDEPTVFELSYLGFEASSFESMEEAKNNAPEFARMCLSRLAEMITD